METFIYFSGSVTFHVNTTLQIDLIYHICVYQGNRDIYFSTGSFPSLPKEI